MKTIWKYDLSLTRPVTALSLPEGSKVLCVGLQGEQLCLWAEVYPESFPESRVFRVFGTGHSLPYLKLDFIGHLQHHGLELFVFEELDT